MKKLIFLKSGIRAYYPYFFLPLIVLYLSFNVFDGNNGLLSHSRLDFQIMSLENSIKDMRQKNALYEVKINSLKKIDLNHDLIDEQIRNVLGYGKTNEFVVFFD